MSKHNYTQYSSKPKQNYNKQIEQKKTVSETVKMDTKPVTAQPDIKLTQETSRVARPSLVNETVETVSLPDTVEGVVVHCAKLNVRENATVDSAIVIVLDAMSEIKIDVNKSTENWFYIYSATGAEGYCMKQYVEAHM